MSEFDKLEEQFDGLKKEASDYDCYPMWPINKEDKSDAVIGYMDLIDFECELGAAGGGNRVFPCIADLNRCKKCVVECGIVEVEVKIRKVLLAPYRHDKDKDDLRSKFIEKLIEEENDREI